MSDGPTLPFEEEGDSRLARRARAFHDANPQVMAKLVDIGRDLRRRGVQRVGIKLLFERLRWLSSVRTEGDKYALNNNYTAWYARQLMEQYAELEGLFAIRDSAHDPDYHTREIRG